MTVSYDVFTDAFLDKVTEYKMLHLPEPCRGKIVDGYMQRACAAFALTCARGIDRFDDDTREIELDDVPAGELYEIIDIVTDGMVYQWIKQYVAKQENLENMLNTGDFSSYSPAELTYRLTDLYATLRKGFQDAVYGYSYRHGALEDLHI